MNREIKFRGKTKKGEWVEGALYEFNKSSFIIINKSHKKYSTGYETKFLSYGLLVHPAFKVLPKSVGQYLRKDKNGVDIYSNMPIRYRDTDYPNGFVWDESGLRWTLNDGYFHTHYGRTGTGGKDDYLDLEVVENPELLEGDSK